MQTHPQFRRHIFFAHSNGIFLSAFACKRTMSHRGSHRLLKSRLKKNILICLEFRFSFLGEESHRTVTIIIFILNIIIRLAYHPFDDDDITIVHSIKFHILLYERQQKRNPIQPELIFCISFFCHFNFISTRISSSGRAGRFA